MNATVIKATIEFLLKLTTGGVIPKGWATKLSSSLGVVAGVGLLAASAQETFATVLATGSLPTELSIREVFGLVLTTQGIQGTGLGRKIEALEAKLAAALAPPSAP